MTDYKITTELFGNVILGNEDVCLLAAFRSHGYKETFLVTFFVITEKTLSVLFLY